MAGRTLTEMIIIKVYVLESIASVLCLLKRFAIKKMAAAKFAVEDFGAFLARVAIKKLAAAKVVIENSVAFLERATTETRVAARVTVGFFGICLLVGAFVALFSSMIFFPLGKPGLNLLCICVVVFGALILQFAREDFDRD